MASSSKQPGIAVNKSVLTPVMTLEGHEPYMPSFGYHSKHYKDISYISYFPDGKQMISRSRDKTIRRWDLREGKEIKEAREVCDNYHSGEAVVSRDGRWVVTADWRIKICNIETGNVKTQSRDSCWISCMDISPDGTLVAAGTQFGRACVWSLDTGKIVAGPLECSDDYVGALRFSEDSRKLAVISRWGIQSLRVWDVQARKLDVTRETITSNFLSTSSPIFWTTKDKSIVAAFNLIGWVAYRDVDDTCMTIYEFDASTLKTVGAPFKGHTDTIWGLALSLDCVLLASASDDNTIKLWSFESRQVLASFNVQVPNSIILSPDSCQLAYTTREETKIYICNIPANILASMSLAKKVCTHLPIIQVLKSFADKRT
jgi:WD40 repeat protein